MSASSKVAYITPAARNLRTTEPEPKTAGLPTLGFLEWLRPGEYERAEQVLSDLRAMGVRELRTGISWADWYTAQAQEWYDWLIPKLAGSVKVLPCFHYTPPSLGVVPKTSAPPRQPKDFADFLDVMLTRYGEHFEWVELWNEPNNLNDWDWRLDPNWEIFSDMIGKAAYWARFRGKKVALGGMCPTDPNWLRLICERGVAHLIDAYGIHGFPGIWDYEAREWSQNVGQVQAVLEEFDLSPEIWITETGYSTWRHDEYEQVLAFQKAMEAPVDRVYWYSVHDLHPDLPHQDGFHVDERHYHFGVRTAAGRPKLLFRLLEEGGLERVRSAVGWKGGPKLHRTPRRKSVLITGGVGFVGTNLADRLLSNGEPVAILDNISRPGVERNLEWLRRKHGNKVQIHIADIRDAHKVKELVASASQIYHLAAQVAVTTSLADPREDFDINARGTLNVLEAMRSLPEPPPLVFTSTNKVYGGLPDLALTEDGLRYLPIDGMVHKFGFDESLPLNFCSPYGCSKGAADQYVLDYAHTFGLPAAVFRMSCIYGPHQFGNEDQGWVAHFLIRALERREITVYGTGRQVRDVLFADDLVDAFLAAREHAEVISGRAFNIGGGPANTLSLIELVDRIREMVDVPVRVAFRDWRPADQYYYVSNTEEFQLETGWSPQISVSEGLNQLHRWLVDSKTVERSAPIHLVGGMA